MHQNENNYFGPNFTGAQNYDFQRTKRHLSNCLWLSYNKLMDSPHFKYTLSISYNVTVFEWYLPLCLELSLSCFSHNVFQGGCDCNWSGAGRWSRGRSGGGTTEAEAAPEQPRSSLPCKLGRVGKCGRT